MSVTNLPDPLLSSLPPEVAARGVILRSKGKKRQCYVPFEGALRRVTPDGEKVPRIRMKKKHRVKLIRAVKAAAREEERQRSEDGYPKPEGTPET